MARAKNTTEVLTAAKWLLENVGWSQGDYVKYNPSNKPISFCSIGAIQTVEVDSSNLITSAENFLRSFMPDRSIVSFNDNPVRTKEEVIKYFDKAIKKSKKNAQSK